MNARGSRPRQVGAFLLCLALAAPAAPARAASGSNAAAFLQLGFGARPLGMAEAFTAVADDASALYYNPAGLAFAGTRPRELAFAHALHFEDIRMTQGAVLVRPLGLSFTRLGLDGIERRTGETAEPEGSFGASDFVFGVSYGRSLGRLGLGGTAKVVRQTIGEFSATAYAADLGVLFRLDSLPVSLGASVSNLGSGVRFIERSFPLPTTVRLGASWGGDDRVPAVLAAQVDLPRGGDPVGRLGLEYLGFGPLPLRTGYLVGRSPDRAALLGDAFGKQPTGLSNFFGLFMGFGFKASSFNLDYALLPFGELGNSHRFSLQMGF